MTDYDPGDVPVYEDTDVRDLRYREAQAEGEPYLAVEAVAEGYAVTFDLMPAGAQLTGQAHERVRERLVETVEATVADPDSPETEVSQSLGRALGSVAAFEQAETARTVAAALAGEVLDEANWEAHEPPEDVGVVDPREN